MSIGLIGINWPQCARRSIMRGSEIPLGTDARVLSGAVLIHARNGHNYAWELTESPGIRDSGSGAGRLVRYSEPSGADCLPGAVADVDSNRESYGDLPG